jgi:hypothetical protein
VVAVVIEPMVYQTAPTVTALQTSDTTVAQ